VTPNVIKKINQQWEKTMKSFSLTRRALMLGAATALAATSLTSAAVAQDAADFKGKTVNVVVFTGPGAPPDIWFRSLAPYLTKYLPGNPEVGFINKDGAGSMISANYIANAAAPDGLTVGAFNAVAMDKAARKDPSALFDLRKMEPIGARQLTRVMPVRAPGIKNFDEFKKSGKKLIIGMESDATPYFDAFFKLTGLQGQIISSYQDFPQTLQAFRGAEVDSMPMANVEWLLFASSLTPEGVSPMWQMGYVDATGNVVAESSIADVPTGHALALAANPDAASTPEWKIMTASAAGQTISDEIWAPPGTPAPYVEAWRKAFASAVTDPQFVAEHMKAFGVPVNWTSGEDTRKAVETIMGLYGN
jgi:tripartite-type tricarboxylate transporter receptor subunit TctC